MSDFPTTEQYGSVITALLRGFIADQECEVDLDAAGEHVARGLQDCALLGSGPALEEPEKPGVSVHYAAAHPRFCPKRYGADTCECDA